MIRVLCKITLTTALMTGVASAQTTIQSKPDAPSTSTTMHKDGDSTPPLRKRQVLLMCVLDDWTLLTHRGRKSRDSLRTRIAS
jgi:hypothetical protein